MAPLARSNSTPVDVSSSSEAELTNSEDEYWKPPRGRKNVETVSKSSTPRESKKYGGKFKPAIPSTEGFDSPSSLRAHSSWGGSSQPFHYPVGGTSTPHKPPKTPAGTPGGRGLAIEAAFRKLDITDQKPKVIMVETDSEDDNLVPTDEEPGSSPTRPSLQKTSVPTSDSSKSSMNSLFPPVSATSSLSSVSSNTITPQPARVADVFSPVSVTSKFSSASSTTIRPKPIRVAHVSTAGSPNVAARRPSNAPSSQSLPSAPASSSSPSTFQNPSSEELYEAVVDFARGPFAADLKEHSIAHDKETQSLMDEYMIGWGTQFELARGVVNGSWTWSDVRANVSKLQGRNEDSAFKVQQVMKNQTPSSNDSFDMTIWRELDREQDAIMENQGRGLGLMGEWHGVKDWYGGQIQQLARLEKDDHSKGGPGKFKVTLEPLEKRRSHRYGRFYGSRRFIQLRVPEEFLQKDGERVTEFLTAKFIICGRTFYPFCSKEGSIYLVETNENHDRDSGEWSGDQFRMSFQDFINWHNPIAEPKNHRQTKSKYATRFALGLSNSVPALEFKAENITIIDDITADDWPKDKKNPPANKLMTDGCGFINHSALRAIVEHMGYESLPAGVQGRIAGGKGFWILDPLDESTEPRIQIRNSQKKIHYPTYDRAHCIFDLLAPSRSSPPIALTQQSIMNLFHNGISAETLVHRMEQGLEEEVAPLLDWDKSHGMLFLWDAINKAGNVSGTRSQRVSVALNRALGLKGRDWGRDETDNTESNGSEASEDKTSTGYTGRNMYSGAPLALHEVALELVQSGFHPSQSKLLNSKIGYIVQSVIKGSVEKYRIPILESLGAFIVPDPLGVLEEGEVSYRFSKPRKDPRTQMLVHTLTGDIIVGRYPMRLPSDMQKVTAVDKRELDKWPDVLIISIKGSASLASLLAGGDMDGDEIIAISDPEIVEPFENKPLVTEPPTLIEESFAPNAKVESLENFCFGAKNRSRIDTSNGFIETLIGNLSDSQVGLYSMMHESAVVALGYDHPESIRLAYIFSTLLDSSKTGHRLRRGVKDQDLKTYGKSQRDEASDPTEWDILSILKNAATKKGEELVRKYDSKKVAQANQQQKSGGTDKELLAPYSEANDQATRLREQFKVTAYDDELSRIRKHVWAAFDLFRGASASARNSPQKKGSKSGKPKQEDPMLAAARAYVGLVENIVFISNVEQVKASFAYAQSETFAFNVAFQELCHIKAMASAGGHTPTLRMFDEAKTASASYFRALRASDGKM